MVTFLFFLTIMNYDNNNRYNNNYKTINREMSTTTNKTTTTMREIKISQQTKLNNKKPSLCLRRILLTNNSILLIIFLFINQNLITNFVLSNVTNLKEQGELGVVNGAGQQQQQPQQEQRNFVDLNCKWPKDEPPSEGERILFVLKCDFQLLIRNFEQLMSELEPNGPKELVCYHNIENMIGVDNSELAKSTWREILAFDSIIDRFFNSSMEILNRKEFCTYPTIKRFEKLKTSIFTIGGSKILADLYDLLAIEYHSYCLIDVLKKLPKIPDIVKQVVDLYIDGGNSHAKFNRPAGFNDEKKDEFKFDLMEAIEKNGKLKDVVLVLIDSTFDYSLDRVKEFKNECKNFLINIEERWQSMEMMNKMLSTRTNAIEEFNNFLMRALIPTKYADVCSQLSAIS